ncbi:glycoside hydrolase family 2 [Rhodanobacter aciditrophus]|uniref:glycoside hydrolase family 2 n=1 Tax=Rhodanobacter aciditrophus TaxID=1623218 RepID=UPI003CF2A2C9
MRGACHPSAPDDPSVTRFPPLVTPFARVVTRQVALSGCGVQASAAVREARGAVQAVAARARTIQWPVPLVPLSPGEAEFIVRRFLEGLLLRAILLIAVAGWAMPSARAELAGQDAAACAVAGHGSAGAAAVSAADQPAVACPAMRIRIGRTSHLLTGPWRFHLGDDVGWAAPGFDDARWEPADLTPAPGAHDSDVGLTNYVPGWRARGHGAYSGYAWYRLRIAVDVPAGTSVALLAPAYVEDAYQLFWNGTLLGGSGDFSGKVPVIYSTRPQVFRLPPMPAGVHDAVIAVRVWMRAGLSRDPDAGGIHIPPSLGASDAVDAQYRSQWRQTIEGYVLEVVEPFGFVLLAMLAWRFRKALAPGGFAPWLCAALLLTAAYRLNQATYYWTPYESLPVYLALYSVLPPLGLAAWLMAWRHWYRLERWRWLSCAIGIATVLGAVLVLTLRDATYAMVSPLWRVPLAVVLLATAVLGLRRRQPDRLLAFAVVLSVAVSQFPAELSALGVPGIWFPFGVGVSRTQYAYAAIIAGLAVLLVRRVRGVAAKRDVAGGASERGSPG